MTDHHLERGVATAHAPPRRRGDDGLPPEIYVDLVETLFGTTGSFLSGVAGVLVVLGLVYVRSGDWFLLGCAGVILLLSCFRVGVFLAHRRTPVAVRRAQAPQWESLYAAGGVGFMTATGMSAAAMIQRGHNNIDILYGVVMVLGCVGQVSGRNAGRPGIVLGQALGLCGPVAVTLLCTTDAWLSGLAAIFLFVLASVKSTTHFLNRMLVSALLSGRASRLQGQQFSTALDSMSHGLCMLGQDGAITVMNHRLSEFFALPELVQDSSLVDLIDAIARYGALAPAETADFTRDILANVAAREPRTCTHVVGPQIFLFRCEPMDNGGSVMVVEDVTAARKSAEQVERLAHFDMLTGLTNRFQFHAVLEARLADLPSEGLALFTIDLDRFKEVNDTLGHPMGDKLLRQVANRLRHLARPTDVVARFGGDEFQLLVQPDPDAPSLDILAARIVDAVSQPYRIHGHAISIGASIGIAVAPGDARNADDLLKAADMALYAAKSASRGTFRHFVPALDAAAQRKRRVEQELRAALTRNELEVFYQPAVDIRSGRIKTCEALVRWRHPERGLVPPDQFIPVAEDTGMIADIGEFVLAKACADAALWPDDIRVAVNVSAKQFLLRGNLVDRVAETLARSGLPANRLEIEITESTLVEAKAPLAQLGELGVLISLDDFGTGYSSLSYLRQFPVHKIKIDRSFIIKQDEVSLAIIDAVSFLANALRVELVVEGVETEQQLDLLIARRIHLIQGFLFSRPVPLLELLPKLGETLRVPAVPGLRSVA